VARSDKEQGVLDLRAGGDGSDRSGPVLVLAIGIPGPIFNTIGGCARALLPRCGYAFRGNIDFERVLIATLGALVAFAFHFIGARSDR
jgi:hypothetical protein